MHGATRRIWKERGNKLLYALLYNLTARPKESGNVFLSLSLFSGALYLLALKKRLDDLNSAAPAVRASPLGLRGKLVWHNRWVYCTSLEAARTQTGALAAVHAAGGTREN